MTIKPGNTAAALNMAALGAATLSAVPNVDEGFRSVHSISPEEMERVAEVRSHTRRCWKEIPLTFTTRGPLKPKSINEAKKVINRFTGLLEAYPNLTDENLIRMFDNFLLAEEWIDAHIDVPGAAPIMHLAWSEFMNWRAPAHRVAGYLNEIARIGALMAKGRNITAVGAKMPEITIKAWSTDVSWTNGKIRPKKLTLRPEIDAIENGIKAIEIKNASLSKRTFVNYALKLLEQGDAPEYPLMIEEGERQARRQILSAIRFVNQLLYYRKVIENPPLNMLEYQLTSVRRIPDSIVSAMYGFMGENFMMIQYDHMFSSDGIVI